MKHIERINKLENIFACPVCKEKIKIEAAKKLEKKKKEIRKQLDAIRGNGMKINKKLKL